MPKSGFFDELKRRHVWRVAAAYAVAGWLLVQIATQVFPFFQIPDWLVRLVVVLVVLGFPVAVVLVWMFEMTPAGLRRTEPPGSPDARPEHVTRQVARKLNIVIITVLVIAVGLLGWRVLALRRAPRMVAALPTQRSARPAVAVIASKRAALKPSSALSDSAPGDPLQGAAAFDPPADTLVVLPFKNLNGDPKQAYFSDGITEELTNTLGRNAALHVIAWDTASTFRDPKQAATEIGRKLNVANLLHGTIEREGSQVRITAELVNTVTGYQLWSAHYDQPFKNIFKVQDQVSGAIANALQVKFAQADQRVGGTRNPQAHDLVLKGVALLEQHDVTSFPIAQRDFERAINLDPGYADAYAALAGALLNQSDYANLRFEQVASKVRALARKALALDPRNANALRILGVLDLNELKPADARTEFRRSLSFDPNSPHTLVDYALALPVKDALPEVREAIMLNPNAMVAHMNLALIYAYLGEYQNMPVPAKAALRINPGDADGAFLLAFAYQRLHQDQAMIGAFDLAKPSTRLDRMQVQAGRLTYQSLLDPAVRAPAVIAVERLAQAKLAPYSQRNLIQLYLTLGDKASALRQLESLCPAYPIACSDLSLFPMFEPLSDDPGFHELAKKYAIR